MKKYSDKRGLPARVLLPPSGLESNSSAAAARYLAQKEGLTEQQLIDRDLAAMRSTQKTIDCVHVTDLDDLANGVLSDTFILHARSCDRCSAFLQLAEPHAEQEEDFVRAVREQDSLLRLIGNARTKG